MTIPALHMSSRAETMVSSALTFTRADTASFAIVLFSPPVLFFVFCTWHLERRCNVQGKKSRGEIPRFRDTIIPKSRMLVSGLNGGDAILSGNKKVN